MDKQDYLNWLLGWFGARNELPENSVHLNFFYEGWLSSLDTLHLVIDIETSLAVTLPDDVFVDPRFSSLSGLASILHELDSKKYEYLPEKRD